jgi:biopolymer transport protein ExbB/TolQ
MNVIPWTCPSFWLIVASVVAVLLMLSVLWHWRRRHVRQQARSKAAQRAVESEAQALEESMLQSGQGLILRFEAIARRLPLDHPVRRDIVEALDRAEYVLEKGLDRAQHRRDIGATPSSPEDSDAS